MSARCAGLAALTLGLALAGCIPEEGPMMKPGEDCMECHGGRGEGGEDDARAWSVAGTIAGRQGARVTISDRNGWTFTLRSNRAGNFYTAENVAFPLRSVTVDGAAMSAGAGRFDHGSCNASACHPGGVGGSGGGD